ncbi:MAG: hypothetical protein WDO16_25885 [Bacteroidota bacterium]
MLETRTAGDNQQVSEVVKLGDVKLLYRLKVDENVLHRRNISARPTEYVKQIMDAERRTLLKNAAQEEKNSQDTSGKQNDFFQNEFQNEKPDTNSKTGRVIESTEIVRTTVLKKARVFEYRPPKFFADYVVTGFSNSVLAVNKFQPYGGGAGPIYMSNGNDFNGLIRMGTSDLMEDVKFSGGIRIAPNLRDNDVLFEFTNLRKRLDWGVMYYRSSNQVGFSNLPQYLGKEFANYYLLRLKYPIDRTRSIRATLGPRFDKLIITSRDRQSLQAEDQKSTYGQFSLEYVYDNTLNPATNIWTGLRYKIFGDWFTQLSDVKNTDGKFLFNAGFDVRNYVPIYRNLIWAVRAGGDFSWGKQRVIYYLGGVDNWFSPKFNDANRPINDYTYQSLAVNLRGFKQNVANGNNALVLNSEIRVPVFSTFFNKPINNAFLRNFQVIQFFDLGTAWDSELGKIERPSVVYGTPPITVRVKAGGIGPLAGGYGFGARSTLLGYFIRVDAAWQMNGVFRGKPMWYFAMGLDF